MPSHELVSPLPFSTPDQTEDGFLDFVGQSALWDQPWISAGTLQRDGDDSNAQIKTPVTANVVDSGYPSFESRNILLISH